MITIFLGNSLITFLGILAGFLFRKKSQQLIENNETTNLKTYIKWSKNLSFGGITNYHFNLIAFSTLIILSAIVIYKKGQNFQILFLIPLQTILYFISRKLTDPIKKKNEELFVEN